MQQEGNRWWTLAAVCVATFMLLLDITIVNVALPDIARSLHSSFTDLQWVIDAYSLSLAALLLTAGALADLLGRRRIFMIGLGLFSASSLLCALSSSPAMLDAARALQGIGGAAMFATSLALLAGAFHGRDRGTAFGIWGATIGLSVAIGPLVGGLLTEKVAWQSIFYLNVPIGIGAIYVTLTRVAETRDPDAAGIDWAGLVTFSAGLFCLVYALVRGNADGWTSGTILACLVAAGVLLPGFVWVESRQRRPMFDLTLFRKPAFLGASLAAFALSASMFAMFLYLTLYIQNALGYSPLQAGLRFLPTSLVSFVVAAVAGRLSARLPMRALVGAGLTLTGVGLLLMGGLNADSGWTALLAGFVVAGAGVGMANPTLASTAVGVVVPERAGMAAGIGNTFRQTGIATGIAALGAVFEHLAATKVVHAFAAAPAAVRARVAQVPSEVLATGSPKPFHAIPGGAHMYLAGFTGALNTLFVISGATALAGAVLGFALIRGRDFVAPPGAEGAPAAA
ncbi:MAG TPA: MFS transporter [Solirubrobacteraceae bacterium]|nr:MFS transporter [Solirubrobacteraceae bacterium]